MSDLSYTDAMIDEIKGLLLNARQRVAVQVNTELLSTYWNIGRIIVEHEQDSRNRAEYGKQVLKQLSRELTKEFGKGFNRRRLLNCHGRITVNFCPFQIYKSEAFMKRKLSILAGRSVN